MNKEEKWIDDRIDVSSYIGHSAPSQELLNQLKSIPYKARQQISIVPAKIIWAAAASIVILIGVNLFSMNSYSTSNESMNTVSNIQSDFEYLNQL